MSSQSPAQFESDEDLRARVRERYGAAARAVAGGGGSCGGGGASGGASCCAETAAPSDGSRRADPISGNLYASDQLALVPEAAGAASLGCGNPTALAELRPGETVLDLGSGGGMDVLLSARRVGPGGKAYGLDMTDEMLALARENQRRAGAENVEFLRGQIEAVPLPDASVDVIISNCVVNLSANKDQVFREAFRVLKPGGRLAISDVATRGEIPAEIRRSLELWIGCVAGALDAEEYAKKLSAAGFEDVGLEPTRVYRAADAREFLASAGIDVDQAAAAADGRIFSAFVRARKPAA